MINGWLGTVKYRKKSSVVTLMIKDIYNPGNVYSEAAVIPSGYYPSIAIDGYANNTTNGSPSFLEIDSAGKLYIRSTLGTTNVANSKYNGFLTYVV